MLKHADLALGAALLAAAAFASVSSAAPKSDAVKPDPTTHPAPTSSAPPAPAPTPPPPAAPAPTPSAPPPPSAPPAPPATPCFRTEFKTILVGQACVLGGQPTAKDVMKQFLKEKKIKSCNQCHEKLAPRYELKPDGLEQFQKAGGK